MPLASTTIIDVNITPEFFTLNATLNVGIQNNGSGNLPDDINIIAFYDTGSQANAYDSDDTLLGATDLKSHANLGTQVETTFSLHDLSLTGGDIHVWIDENRGDPFFLEGF